MTKIRKGNAPVIKEELIPMTEEQLQESIEKLTQIYALVYGWEPKRRKEGKRLEN